MRNIKFRAWDKQAKKMIYSDEVYPKSMYKFEFDILNNFEFKLMKMIDRYNVTDDEGNDKYQEVFEAVEADIMQYTGLKDVEVNEIYEGDIIEKEFVDFGNGDRFVGIVTFIDGCWCVENENKRSACFLFNETDVNSVIGNIYENPELDN